MILNLGETTNPTAGKEKSIEKILTDHINNNTHLTAGDREDLRKFLWAVDDILGTGTLSVRKVYASITAMNADTAPTDGETGKPLKFGQLVSIANVANLSDPDNGKVYRRVKNGWEYSTKIGNGLASSMAVNTANIADPSLTDLQKVAEKVANGSSVYNISVELNKYDYADDAAAIAAVPEKVRKLGLIVKFKSAAGWRTLEYVGIAVDPTSWNSEDNWNDRGAAANVVVDVNNLTNKNLTSAQAVAEMSDVTFDRSLEIYKSIGRVESYNTSIEKYSAQPTLDHLWVPEIRVNKPGIINKITFAQNAYDVFDTKLAICDKPSTMRILKLYNITVTGGVIDLTQLNIKVDVGQYVGIVSKVVNANSLFNVLSSDNGCDTWYFTPNNIVVNNMNSYMTANKIAFDFSFDVMYSNVIDELDNINNKLSGILLTDRVNTDSGEIAIIGNNISPIMISEGYTMNNIANPIGEVYDIMIMKFTRNASPFIYPVKFNQINKNGKYGLWINKTEYTTLRLQLSIVSSTTIFCYVDFQPNEMVINASKSGATSGMTLVAKVVDTIGDFVYFEIYYTSNDNLSVKWLIPWDTNGDLTGNVVGKPYHMICYFGDVIEKYNTPRKVNINTIVNKIAVSSNNVRLFLPNNIVAEVGKPLYIFKGSITNSIDYRNYNIQVIMSTDATNGKDYSRYWMYTPSEVGTNTVVFELFNDNRQLLDSKSVTINCISRTSQPSTECNVLFIGDSLTFYNRISDEFIRVLTSHDLYNVAQDTISLYECVKPSGLGWGNITSIGTQKNNYLGWTAQTYNEGRSGWKWFDFIQPGSPFYIDGVLDFNKYVINNGLKVPTHVYIGLGWNDSVTLTELSDGTFDTSVIISNARVLINAIISAYPSIKIRIWTQNIPGVKGGVGNHPYGSAVWADEQRMRRSMLAIADAYKELIDEYTNVGIVWATAQIDSEYCLQEEIATVNGRITQTEVRGRDYVHPSDAGFFQITDAIITDFKSIL